MRLVAIFVFGILSGVLPLAPPAFADSEADMRTLIACTPEQMKLGPKDQRRYLDLEEPEDVAHIFNQPGFNWKSCRDDKSTDPRKRCRSVGWPTAFSRLYQVNEPPRKITVVDEFTGETVEKEFVKVKFCYYGTYNRVDDFEVDENGKLKVIPKDKYLLQNGEGYIDSDWLKPAETTPVYGRKEAKPPAPPPAPKPKSEPCPPENETEKLKDAARGIEEKALSDLEQFRNLADRLSKIVGQCSPMKPDDLAKLPNGTNIYDRAVLPMLAEPGGSPGQPRLLPGIAERLKDLKTANGKQITGKQLIEIDSLARAMFAEMGVCFKQGLQYPMAVAKSILNRAEDFESLPSYGRQFVTGHHDSRKPAVAKVSTSPTQYSFWLTKIGGRKNTISLRHGVCPVSPEEKSKGPAKSPYENMWRDSVRIATEAVLYPKSFAGRTRDMKYRHYTSNMVPHWAKNGKMRRVTGLKIDGRPVDSGRCMMVWDDQRQRKPHIKLRR